MEAGRAPVAMLDRVDTRLAERGLDILDPLAIEAQPPRKRRNSVASDLLIAKLARKRKIHRKCKSICRTNHVYRSRWMTIRTWLPPVGAVLNSTSSINSRI